MTHPVPPPTQPRLRPDVVLTRDGETQGGYVVKDPRSRRYYQIDALAGTILQLLDGQRTPVDIQVALAVELGEELTLEEIHDFIDGLKEKGLIDGGGPPLPARAPDLGRQVLEALEQGGFKIRHADDPVPPGVHSTRENLFEARKFDEAVAMIREGRFQAALRAFEEILAVNPDNRRAAAIRQILLQAGSVRTKALSEPAKKKERSNPLYYRIPLFDPDRIFGALEPWVRFVWTKPFAVLYVLAVVLAGYVAVAHRVELLERLPNLSAGGWVGALIVAGVALTTLHEFAHGLTCKHFGGKVPELGFLLILFFMPALYVDVSDAWLFRGRARRALVGMAGPMHDLLAASVGILVWRVLPPGPWDVALFTIVVAAAASLLMNLNPLLRLDGYYILSDLSGIANLRQGALRAFGRALQRLRGQRPATSLTRRGAAFMAVYGGLSLVYISLVLFLLGRFVTGVSTNVAGLWGPVFIGLVLIVLLRRPFGRLVRAIGRGVAGMSWAGAAKLALVAGGFAAVTAIPWPLKVQGPVQIKTRERATVRPEVAGQLGELLVREGDQVSAGQVVARLDRSELQAELDMTRARIERAQAQLDLLLGGPEKEQVAKARERVKAAEAEVAHLRSRHERLKRLRDEGLVAADLYEQVHKELKVSEGSLRAALDEARLVEKGARPEEIESARAEVARLQTKAADVLRQLAACELRAPIDGVVVTPDLRQRLGQRIPPGGELMEIADVSELRPEIRIAEREIGDVRVGQDVRFKLAAYPDQTFRGTVREVSPAAEDDELGQAVFRVRASVEEGEGLIRPGMTGSAKILCGRHALGRLWVRRALRLIDPSLL
jgi:multidrug resistance efflux pump